jgi:hypothetical protein
MKDSKSIEASEHKNGKEPKKAGKEPKESKERHAAPPSELSLLLGKIGEAARVLNGAGSDATRRIEAVEQSLLDAEPGVAVWSTPLLSEKASYQRDEASPSEPALRVVTLGFARVKKDKWGLCVREELKVRKGIAVSEELTLLRKSERNLRIAALPHLEQLVREVLATLEQQVSVLEQLKQGAVAADAAESRGAEPRGAESRGAEPCGGEPTPAAPSA